MDIKNKMKKVVASLFLFAFVSGIINWFSDTNKYTTSKSILDSKKNVLFITVDDLRTDLGCYASNGQTNLIRTPNIDRLAGKSLLLRNAYAQIALCSPSRTSLLTGRRPDTTHVYDLVKYFRTESGRFVTIPEYFKQNGYVTVGIGKIFHSGSASGNNDDVASWSEPYYHAPNLVYWDVKNISHRAVSKAEWTLKPLPDMQIADRALKTLERLVLDNKRPFFLAIGFHKPHLPFIVPDTFVDLYPMEDITLPNNMFAPVYMPKVAWSYYGELRHYKDIRKQMLSGKINTTLPEDLIKDLRRYYYASVTYTDSLVGKLLTVI